MNTSALHSDYYRSINTAETRCEPSTASPFLLSTSEHSLDHGQHASTKKPASSRSQDANNFRPLSDVDRERFLVKSREAASKSRKKRKMFEQSLGEQCRHIQSENNALRCTVDHLQEEVAALKSLCLQHVDCDCYQIRNHICGIAGFPAAHQAETIPYFFDATLPCENQPRQDSFGLFDISTTE